MIYYCYIIFSRSINRYYIGYSADVASRLQLHLDGSFGGKSYTSKAKDWEIFLLIPCRSIEKAMELEKLIKSKKSRKFLENLKRYPELLEKISKDFI